MEKTNPPPHTIIYLSISVPLGKAKKVTIFRNTPDKPKAIQKMNNMQPQTARSLEVFIIFLIIFICVHHDNILEKKSSNVGTSSFLINPKGVPEPPFSFICLKRLRSLNSFHIFKF